MTTVSGLGYLAFQVKDVAAWEAFATGVLGLTVADRDEAGRLLFQMDDRFYRLAVGPGGADDLAAVGWEVESEEALEALAAGLSRAGVDVAWAAREEAASRRVARLARFVDPGGVPSELFVGLAPAPAPFSSPLVRKGFVTGDLGMGHVVLTANNQAESASFYRELLGFRLSDRIVADVHGYRADLAFFHANRRHHSVAFGDRQRKRLHHFMLEVRSFDDVGLAFDRTLRAGLPIMQTLGRHPNDRMFSFYAKTPSGFHFEYGWGGRSVDDATWEPTTYDHISEWGHHPPEFVVPRKETRT